MDLVVKALMFDLLLKGGHHLLNNSRQYLEVLYPREGEDLKEVEAGLPKVDEVAVVCHNSIMVGPLSIKVGEEDLLNHSSSMVAHLSIKEGEEDLLNHSSTMVAHLSIKVEAGEGLLSKEAVDMVVDVVAVATVVVALK